MQFKTNLATRSYINKKKLKIAMAVTIAVLTVLLVVQARICAYNAGEISRLGSAHTALEAQSKKKQQNFTERDYTRLLADVKFANSIIERKAYAWTGLLNRLENVVPPGVTLTSVQPNPKDRTLEITGIAPAFGNIRHFIENVESSTSFTDVYLQKHERKEEKPGELKTISFAVNCRFVP